MLEPGADLLQRRARTEHLAHTLLAEGAGVGLGDDAPAEHEHVVEVAVAQLLHHPGEEREVGAGEQRQADGVGILLQHRLGDLLRRLVETGVDDLETVVPQGPRDRLRPAIVAVEPWLGDDDAVRALHEPGTLDRRRGSLPTRGHTGPVPPQLRSPFARAVVPVFGGIVVLAAIMGVTWLVAAYISGGGAESSERLVPTVFEVGNVESIAATVAEDGPILFPGLDTTTGQRTLVLDHEGTTRPAGGGSTGPIRPTGTPRATSARSSGRAGSPTATAASSTSPSSARPRTSARSSRTAAACRSTCGRRRRERRTRQRDATVIDR